MVRPKACLLLSGVCGIDPLRQSILQPLIELTGDEVLRFSPVRLPLRDGPDLRILVGDRETDPFHMQATDLAGRFGTAVRVIDGDDMSVVLDLGDPGNEAGRGLYALCKGMR